MSILDAIILGIVQGLTEFLPVSSSGHLAITQHILGWGGESNLFFDVMLHVGTLAAVIVFYRKLIWSLIKEFIAMVRDIFTGKFRWKEMNYERRLIVMLFIGLLPLLLMFVPIGNGMKLKDLADVFGASPVMIVPAVSLMVTSALLFIGILCNKRSCASSARHMKDSSPEGKGRESYTVLDAVCVGLMQVAAALFPGLSRSGSTLAVGEMRGISKQKALDYTFVLGIPAILAAALLEGLDAVKEGVAIEPLPLIIGVVVSAVVGYLAILIFKWFLKTDKMMIFVIYTAVVGVAMLVISIIELNMGINIFSQMPLK